MSPSMFLGECIGFGLGWLGIASFFCWIWRVKKKRPLLLLVFFLSFGIYFFRGLPSYETKAIEGKPKTEKTNHTQVNSKVEEFHLRFADPNYIEKSGR